MVQTRESQAGIFCAAMRESGAQRSLELTTKGGTDMSFLTWIVLGLLAGFVGCKLVNRRREGLVAYILLGIWGAVVGGLLFDALGVGAVGNLNLNGLFLAVVGSVLLLSVYHALFRRS